MPYGKIVLVNIACSESGEPNSLEAVAGATYSKMLASQCNITTPTICRIYTLEDIPCICNQDRSTQASIFQSLATSRATTVWSGVLQVACVDRSSQSDPSSHTCRVRWLPNLRPSTPSVSFFWILGKRPLTYVK